MTLRAIFHDLRHRPPQPPNRERLIGLGHFAQHGIGLRELRAMVLTMRANGMSYRQIDCTSGWFALDAGAADCEECGAKTHSEVAK